MKDVIVLSSVKMDPSSSPSICLEDDPYEELDESLSKLLRMASDSMEEELKKQGEFYRALKKNLEEDEKDNIEAARQAYDQLVQCLSRESFANLPLESRKTLLEDLQYAFKGAWYKMNAKRGFNTKNLMRAVSNLDGVHRLLNLAKVEAEAASECGQRQTKHDEFVVTVSHCVSPNEFYIQRLCDADKMAVIRKALHCSRAETFPIPDVVEEGNLYAVKDEDKAEWCRGRRLKKFGSYSQGDGPAVDIFTFMLIDEGRMVKRHVPYVRLLPEKLLSTQELALLSSLQPTFPGGPILWTSSETEQFKRHVNGKVLSMKVYTDEAGLTKTDFGQIPSYADEPHIVSIADALIFARSSVPSRTMSSEKIKTFECRINGISRNQRLHAKILAVCDPNRFYLRLHPTDEVDIYEQMENDVQNFYNNPQNGIACAVNIAIRGQAYAVKVGQKWYRAVADPADVMVNVFLVDYGEQHSVSIRDLRHLDDKFMKKAAQAINCRLNSVQPSSQTTVRKFSNQCVEWMRSNTVNKSVLFFVEHFRGGAVGPVDSQSHEQLLAVTLFVENSNVCLNEMLHRHKLAFYRDQKTGFLRSNMLEWASPSKSYLESGASNGVSCSSTSLGVLPQEPELSASLNVNALPSPSYVESEASNGASRSSTSLGVRSREPELSTCSNLNAANGEVNEIVAVNNYIGSRQCDSFAGSVVSARHLGEDENPRKLIGGKEDGIWRSEAIVGREEEKAYVFYPSMGEVGIAVSVLRYYNFQDIYLRPISLENKYREMVARLQDDYRHVKSAKVRFDVGYRCVVKYNSRFYRAEIVEELHEELWVARTFDNGYLREVRPKHVYELIEPYDQVNAFSIHVSLFGVYHTDRFVEANNLVSTWLDRAKELIFCPRSPKTPFGRARAGVLIFRYDSEGGPLEVAGEVEVNLNSRLLAEGLAQEIPSEPFPEVIPSAWPKNTNKVSKLFTAHITWLNKENVLFMHDSNALITLNDMNRNLGKRFRGSKPTEKDRNCQAGDICIAHFRTGGWYRATIIEPRNQEDMVGVHYDDYGNREDVPSDWIRKVTMYHDVPVFAIRCKIHGIRPNARESAEGGWTLAVLNKFHKLLVDKKVEVCTHVQGAIPHVSITMEDIGDVADYVVSQGWARYAM